MRLKADQIKGAGNPKREIKGAQNPKREIKVAQNSMNEVKGTLNSPNKGTIRDHYDPPRFFARLKAELCVNVDAIVVSPVRGRRPSYESKGTREGIGRV